MSFVLNLLKGFGLGAGCILPGISSGILCVIFGIYDKLVNSILNIFKDFKKNFSFLFPIFIGIGVGVFLFGNILKYLFNNYESAIKFAFAGLILGSIPSLFKKSNDSKGFRLHYLLYTFLALFISVFLILLENNINYLENLNINFLFLFISGFLMSIGVVVPGVSSTIILMVLGVYGLYLEAISLLNLSVLLPMGIGLICGCIVFLNIINFFMNRFYSQTMYSIIGFVVGSIFILLPNNYNFINVLFFVLSLCVSLLFAQKTGD